MKKLFFLVTLAAALLCGCNKDNPDGNYVTLGDVTIPVTHAMCTVAGHGFQAVVMDFDGEANGVNIHGFPRIGVECVGKKIDLSKFDSSVNYTLDINTMNGSWPGQMNIKDQGATDMVFKKGTMKLVKEKNGNYTLDINGTISDGTAYIWHITAEYLDPDKF